MKKWEFIIMSVLMLLITIGIIVIIVGYFVPQTIVDIEKGDVWVKLPFILMPYISLLSISSFGYAVFFGDVVPEMKQAWREHKASKEAEKPCAANLTFAGDLRYIIKMKGRVPFTYVDDVLATFDDVKVGDEEAENWFVATLTDMQVAAYEGDTANVYRCAKRLRIAVRDYHMI